METYLTGEEIRKGDVIKYADSEGVIDELVFPEGGRDLDWSIPGGGVLFTIGTGHMFACTWEEVRDPYDPVEFVRRP